jgi:hypothetical protein
MHLWGLSPAARTATLLVLLLGASLVGAEEPYFYGPFWNNLGKGAKRAYVSSQTLGFLATSAPSTYLVSRADKPFQRQVQREGYLGDSAKLGNVLGQPYSQAGTAAVVYGISQWAGNDKLEGTSALMLEAWALTATSVHLIKPIARRTRPDDSNRMSFPSNHAAGSFALATAAQLRHGWRAGVPSYLLASFIAFSRLEQNKHHASDTFFGALIGAHCAYAVWRARDHQTGPSTSLSASAAPVGLLLTVAF